MRQGAGLACIGVRRICVAAAAMLSLTLLTALPVSSYFPCARPALGATEDAKSKPREKAKDTKKQKAKADDKAKGEDAEQDKDKEQADPEKVKGPLTLTIPLSGDDPQQDDSLAGGVTVTSADMPAPSGTLQQPSGAAGQPDKSRFQLQDRQDSLSLTAGPEVLDDAAAKPPAAKAPAKAKQPQAAAKPVAKPTIKPSAKPVAKPAAAKPAPAKAPAAAPPASAEDPQTLSEYFTEEELAAPQSDSEVRIEDLPATDTALGQEHPALQNAPPTAGVIRTTGAASGGNPTLSKVLSGEAKDTRLGAGLTGFSPWRSAGMVLLCLGLAFAAMWAAGRLRSPLRALRQHSLAVIETISIGAGRQIIIIEMNEDALVLGVTPHSINLLDKVPLQQMNSSYSGTVNAIIQREQTALPSEWAQRPAFSKGPQLPAPPPAPPLPNRGYSPASHGHVSVGELRRARALAQPLSSAVAPRSLPRPLLSPEERTKADLIGRIREQLSALEK